MKFLITPTTLSLLTGLLTTTISLARIKDDGPQQSIHKDAQEEAKNDKDSEIAKAEAPSARLLFTNGDKLWGLSPAIDEQGKLLFDAHSLLQTTEFPLDNVLSLHLGGTEGRERPDTLAQIKLQPRFRESQSDTIFGVLHELTPESIQLETWYGGIITLKRSMVQSLKMINNNLGNFFGPSNINEWILSGGKGTWKFHNGALISRASGGIGREMGLTDKSHISFDVTWKKSMRFHMLTYSSDTKKDRPSAYYDLNLSSYMSLRTIGKSPKGARLLAGGRGQSIRLNSDNNRTHFDIFAQKKTGTFIIYMDGQRICLLQSNRAAPVDLGTGLTFIAEERSPIEISGITITPWNGTSLPNQINPINPIKPDQKEEEDSDDPDASEKSDEPQKSDEPTQPPHKIILNNGDEVPGTVGKVKDGTMIIETEYTPIHIPIKYIKSLTLSDAAEEPKKYTGDIRAWFHQGGHITLELASIKDGKIKGRSQATGDVSFDLSAFNRIDFHIYDKKANALRKKMQ